MSITEKLTELKGLLDAGILTQEEFDAQKAAILEGNAAAQSASQAAAPTAPAAAAAPSTPAGDAPPCPPTYMVQGIIALLFCLPGGVIALIQASGVSSAHAAGDYAKAEAASKSAKMWVNISAIPALLSVLFFILSGVIQIIAAL